VLGDGSILLVRSPRNDHQCCPTTAFAVPIRSSRMRGRVVRTVTRLPALPDAGAKQPRLHIAPLPYASACMLGVALDGVKFSLRIFRPVNCETVPDQPFSEVNIADRARRHRAPVLVQRDRDAAHRALGNKGVQFVRGLRPAVILQTIFRSA